MAQVLKLPAYRRLLLAYGLTQVAWAVVSVALAVLVYGRTGSAIGAAGFFLCAQFVPALLSPFLVARLDRRAPGPVMTGLYVVEAALFGLLALLVGHFDLSVVLILALVDGVLAMVVRSLARATSVGVIAPAGLLREGNAVTLTVFSVSIMLGPAVGGVVVASGSVRVALLTGAGMTLLIACALATARGLPDAMSDDSTAKGRLAAAIRYARSEPSIRALLVLNGLGLVFFTMSIPVELVLAQHTLHGGAGGYGALLTTWGGGAIVGSAIFARLRRWKAWVLIALGAGGLGAGFLIMALAPSIVVAAVGAAIAGAGNGIEGMATTTALQEQVREQWIPLMMSLSVSIGQALPGLGILLGGAVAQFGSPRIAFAVAGAGSFLIAAAVWLVLGSRRPDARQLELDVGSVAPLTFAAQQRGGQPRLDETPAGPR